MKPLAGVLCLAVGVCAALWGQQEKPAEAAPTQPAEPQAEAAPVAAPHAEPSTTGWVEVGYRATGDLRGNLDAYRSVVNLGDGPRLLGARLQFVSPKPGGWLDRAALQASGWGGDPNANLRGEALAMGKYRLRLDHRDLAYFNALPSFANPSIQRGVLFSQSQYDIFHRMTDIDVELRPGTSLVPYFSFLRNSNGGRGVSVYQSSFNEYPVGTEIDDSTNSFRGGVRWEAPRFQLTLEQGGTTYDNQQRLFTSDANSGNRTTPFLGQPLFLNTVAQGYDIGGSSVYSRVLLSARPADWIDVYGNFLYARPKTDGRLSSAAAGRFVQNGVMLVPVEEFLILSVARQPHTNGNGGFEMRPARRLRVLGGFLTDRYHTAGSVVSPAAVDDRLFVNYNEYWTELLFDVTSRLAVRGGHKYIWGDALTRAPLLARDFRQSQQGDRSTHAGLGGLTYRLTQKLSAYADVEIARSGQVYFRTSVSDYERIRLRGNYQALASLQFTGSYSYFSNETPGPDGGFEFDSRNASLGFSWTPAGARNVRVIGEYGRTTFASDTTYIQPINLTTRERSFYRENGHSGTALVELGAPALGRTTRFSFGGSLWRSTGSRPSRFYRPTARVAIPIAPHVEGSAEWRWFGMSEPYYLYEAFRRHQAIVSLRFFR